VRPVQSKLMGDGKAIARRQCLGQVGGQAGRRANAGNDTGTVTWLLALVAGGSSTASCLLDLCRAKQQQRTKALAASTTAVIWMEWLLRLRKVRARSCERRRLKTLLERQIDRRTGCIHPGNRTARYLYLCWKMENGEWRMENGAWSDGHAARTTGKQY
jgi:hypothetical protein